MKQALIVILLAITHNLHAQHIRPLREVTKEPEPAELRLIAERLNTERQYYPALSYYQQLEDKGELTLDDRMIMAEIHHKLRHYNEAAEQYQSVIKLEGNPLAYFKLGYIQKALMGYTQATKSFQAFIDKYSGSYPNEARTAYREITGLKTSAKLKGISGYDFSSTQPAGSAMTGAVYANSTPNDEILLTMPYELKLTKKLEVNSDLIVEIDSVEVRRPYRYSNGKLDFIDLKLNDASLNVMDISQGFSGEFYITICNQFGSNEQCDIYKTQLKGSKWSNPEKLSSAINKSGVSTKNPRVATTNSGEKFLFYSSNRAGSYGGFDIWVAKYDQGSFKKAVNLGIGINTDKDEITPFFDEKTGYLFFSSNGHHGLGEMDVFLTKVNWGQGDGQVFNVGPPINTSKDDYYFSLSGIGNKGLLSSNRDMSCCDQVYELNFKTPFTFSELPAHFAAVSSFQQYDSELRMLRQPFNYEELVFSDSNTEFILQQDADIQGFLLKGNIPMDGKKVLLINERGEVVSSTITDNKGEFNFKQLPAGGQYAFVLNENDPGLNIDVEFKDNTGQVFGKLNNAEKPGVFSFKKLDDYESGVWTLEVEDATISGQLLGTSIENEKVLLVDQKGNIVAASQADDRGRFSFKKLPAGEKYAFVLQERDTPLNVEVDIKDKLGKVVDKFSSTTSQYLFKYRALDDYETGIWTIKANDASISGSLVAGRLALSNKKVLLIDENGKVIGLSLTDQTGNFTFKQLPAGKKYSFIIEESETTFNIDVAVLDENGNIVTRFSSNNRKEVFIYRSLEDYESGVYTLTTDDASFKGKLSKDAGSNGEMVVLINEDGNILETVFANDLGDFEFNELEKDQRYAFVVVPKRRDELIQIKVLDNEGRIVEILDNRTRSEIFRYEDLSDQLSAYYAENSTICGQFEEAELTRRQVILINGDGEEVACVESNIYGYFQFDEVPFASEYRFILDGCDSEIILNIEVVDATGATTFLLNNIEDESYFHYMDLNHSDIKLFVWYNPLNSNKAVDVVAVRSIISNLTKFNALRS